MFVECLRERGVLEKADPSRTGGFRALFFAVLRNVAGRYEKRASCRRASDRSPGSSRGCDSAQQSLHAQILVEVRPVDSLPVAEQSPVLSLERIRVQESGEPDQGHAHSPAVREGDRQLVVANRHLHGARVHPRA